MKFRELQEKYGDCEIADIEKLKSLLEEPKKPKTVWDLKDGDTFYWIGVEVIEQMWENSYEIFLDLREAGNVFLTYEEAMKELERRKIETLLKRYAKGHKYELGKENFYLLAEPRERDVCIDYGVGTKLGGNVYFSSYEDAEKAIAEIGEDRLLRDYFQVEMEESKDGGI